MSCTTSCCSTCKTNPSSGNFLSQRDVSACLLGSSMQIKRPFKFCIVQMCSHRILVFFFHCQPDFKWILLFFVTQAFIFNFGTLRHRSVWVTFLLCPLPHPPLPTHSYSFRDKLSWDCLSSTSPRTPKLVFAIWIGAERRVNLRGVCWGIIKATLTRLARAAVYLFFANWIGAALNTETSVSRKHQVSHTIQFYIH